LQNGILPVVLGEAICQGLWAAVRKRPGSTISIDLPNQIVTDPDGNRHSFEINPLRKERLVKGLDDIDVTQGYATQIATVENRRRTAYPWLPVTSQA
jgi:3-isopropylmalate/(R)-2-methylmalate dehydratase small subunit